MEMVKIMSACLTRGKVAKNVLLVLVLFILILTTSSQNVLAGENRQVNASEILDKIAKGELVAEENCTIIGDLDLGKIRSNLSSITVNRRKLSKVNKPVSITNSIIKGDVNFNGIYFNSSVNFDGTKFTGGGNFEQSVFSRSANFRNASFSCEANFGSAVFKDFSYFNGVHFAEMANFNYATFKRLSYFNNVCFNDEARFDDAKFYDEVEFNNVFFKSVAAFRWSEFYNETQFNNATFNEDAQFDNAEFKDKVEFRDSTKFNETASFRDATFTGLADFEDARFRETAIFNSTEFTDVAKFTRASFNGYATFMDATFNKAYFEFANFSNAANFTTTDFNEEAHFQNARFNDTAEFVLAKFKDRAYFTGASFNDTVDFSEADIFLTMKIRWCQLEGKLVYNDYFYQSLIRNFETLGQSEDANDAYYEYKVEKRRHLKSAPDPIRRLLEYIFLDLTCGYGVKPLRPIGWAVLFIGLFAFLYRWIEDKENKKSESDSSLKDRWKRFWEFVFLSVSIFTTLGYWNKWKPAKNHETKFRIGVIIEGFLGWLIMVLFIISLTMTWIR